MAAATSSTSSQAAAAAADHTSTRSNRHHRHPHSSHIGVRGDPEPVEPSDHPYLKQSPGTGTSDDDGAGQELSRNAATEPPPPSNRGKKQAWRRLANGSVDSGPVVMGAASWPALSESTKASPKSSTPSSPPPVASDSPKPVGDGSVSNVDLSSTPNNATVGRQRSFKRGGGGGGSNSSTSGASPNGGVPQNSFPLSTSPSATMNKPTEVSQPDRAGKNSNWEHGSRGVSGSGDHHKGFRRGNNGGGSHHNNNYGNRRDQERGGYDGYHRGRDVHMQQRGPRPLIRPPPLVTPPFIGPPSPLVRPPFGNPMVYPDMPSPVIYVATPPESFRGFPFVPQPLAPPVAFVPAIDTQRSMLLKQIDYYFSPENLCKDIFLRQNMDDQGWVPLSLIAGFNRVKQLTDNMHYILDTVRFSSIVELQGEKIRRRSDWMNWVLSPSNSQVPAVSGQQSPATSDTDNLVHQLQNCGFGESTEQNMGILPSHSSSGLRRSASGNTVNQDGNAQAIERKEQD